MLDLAGLWSGSESRSFKGPPNQRRAGERVTAVTPPLPPQIVALAESNAADLTAAPAFLTTDEPMIEYEESRSTIPLRLAAILLTLFGIFPLAVVIKWAPVVQWLPRAGAEWAVSMVFVALLCFALSRYAGARVDLMLNRARDIILALTPRDFALYAGLFTFLAALGVAWWCFGGQVNGGDEMTQRFQARLLVAGRLWGVAPEPQQFFNGIQTVAIDGRWFGQFPIGHPLLIALGLFVGMPWIVNPILGGWTAASVYRFARKTSDETTARLATILFATSPFVLLMSGSQMNHASALAFLMYGLVGLADWTNETDSTKLWLPALRTGFGFAASAAIRPYEAAVFAGVVGVFQLIHARGSPAHIRSFLWQLLGGVLPVAFLLYANAQQTGHPFLFGYDALNGIGHRPGFHQDPTGVDFTPVQGVHHISAYLLLLNASLFDGPIPSVILIVAALALVQRATKWSYLLVALIAALCVAYACYWAESFFVGPRFLYAAVPFFVMVVATLPRSLAARARSVSMTRAARLLLPLAAFIAWALPPHVARFQGAWEALGAEHGLLQKRHIDLDDEIRAQDIDDALVIVHESWHGRLTARLRAIGTPALTAESFLREFDACALQIALDNEERSGAPVTPQTVQRVARMGLMYGQAKILPGTNQGTTLAFARPLHPYCAPELEVDREQSAALDRFLADARFDRDGKLAGRVIYVRDFGLPNQKLLARYADRTWYRYRPRIGPNDHGPVFVPYSGR